MDKIIVGSIRKYTFKELVDAANIKDTSGLTFKETYLVISECEKYWNATSAINEGVGQEMYLRISIEEKYVGFPFWEAIRIYIKDNLIGGQSERDYGISEICKCDSQDLFNFGCPSARGKLCCSKDAA